MRRASSSRKDQLEAPLIGHVSYEAGLHPPDNRLGSAAQHGLAFPREIVPEQPHGLDLVLARQESQGGKPSERTRAEQIAPMVRQPVLRQQPAAGQPEHHATSEDPHPGAHQPTSCRATSAWARVTPSMYSRSPPIGRPRAKRVTLTPIPD